MNEFYEWILLSKEGRALRIEDANLRRRRR